MPKRVFPLEDAFGSVRPSKRHEDFKALSRLAKTQKAQSTMTKMRDFDRVPQVEREEP